MAARKKVDTANIMGDVGPVVDSYITPAGAGNEPAADQDGSTAKVVKTRRTTILLTPQDFEDLNTLAHIHRKSVNALINTAVRQLLSENAAVIEQFKELTEDLK